MAKAYALIVRACRNADEVDRALGEALEIRRCAGPGAVECPAVHGRRCPLRDEARLTICYVSGEHELFTPSGACVSASTAPVIAVLEGDIRPPRSSHAVAVVGGAHGTLGVLTAVNQLFDNPDYAEDREPAGVS